MTNDQFKLYIAKRLDAVTRDIRSGKFSGKELADLRAQQELLETSAKIARSGGPALRRYRRDYERRLTRKGTNPDTLL